MAERLLVEDLNAIFRERDARGKPRWKPQDIQAVRNFLLLDLCRRGEGLKLNEANKMELGMLLEAIGLEESTPPEEVDGLVRAFFQKNPIPPAMVERLQKLFIERAGDRSTLDTKQSFEKWTGAAARIQKDPRDTGDGKNAKQFSVLKGVNIKI